MKTYTLHVLALVVVLGAGATMPPREVKRDFPDPVALPVRVELPAPFVMFDGRAITTRREWERERKPELRALFQHYMYGYLPPPVAVSGVVRRIDANAYGGKATLKEISLHLAGPKAPRLDLLLVIPNRRSGPAPVFLGLNHSGNHAIVDDPAVAPPTTWMRPGSHDVVNQRATEKGRRKDVSEWAIEQSLDRGYAVATCYYGDVFPDKADFNDGLFAWLFTPTPGQTSPGEVGPGAIAMWAWGLHRIVDYLITVPEIDPSRIAVTGHSRLAKTALLAAAFDERIALAIPHQGGTGGPAPSRSRNPSAETVKQINRFHHWFDDNFKKFNDAVERLPFDQHLLVALCAPRPVLYTNGLDDQWANPAGQFEMLKAATPVYRLYGVQGLGVTEMPPVGQLVDSRLGYLLRAGPRVADADYWRTFLDYADKYFRPRTPSYRPQ